MTDIVYFATNHGKGKVLQVQRKLEELEPDLITIEDSIYLSSIPFDAMSDGKISEAFRGYKYNNKKIQVGDFYANELPDIKGVIRYALDKCPIFLIDSHRRFVLLNNMPLSSKSISVYGFLPSGELIMIDCGLHPQINAIKDEYPFVYSSNLAMGRNINELVKLFSPGRVAHFSGKDHYDGSYKSKPLQEIVELEIRLMWNVITNQPLDIKIK